MSQYLVKVNFVGNTYQELPVDTPEELRDLLRNLRWGVDNGKSMEMHYTDNYLVINCQNVISFGLFHPNAHQLVSE